MGPPDLDTCTLRLCACTTFTYVLACRRSWNYFLRFQFEWALDSYHATSSYMINIFKVHILKNRYLPRSLSNIEVQIKAHFCHLGQNNFYNCNNLQLSLYLVNCTWLPSGLKQNWNEDTHEYLVFFINDISTDGK